MDSNVTEKINISLSSTLSFMKLGMENLDVFAGSARKIRVKDVSVINEDNLKCQFYPYSNNSIDIKVEIGGIMGFFNGFFKDEPFKKFEFKYYLVQAMDINDKEILSAISSRETARLIGTGKSVDWLKSTVFQENTDDYRLGLAKRIVSEIENALRSIVKDILMEKFGNEWWDNATDNKLSKSVKEMYHNQFGILTTDGDILINYTYLSQLSKIIVLHWNLFQHLFKSKIEFENFIDELNKIRREEAHNRLITEEHISALDKVYIGLLSKIAVLYPNILPIYLIEGWKAKIKSIMYISYKAVYQPIEIIEEKDLLLRAIKTKANVEGMIKYLKEVILKLESLTVPIQKQEIHSELLECFRKYNELHEQLLVAVLGLHANEIESISNAIKLQEERMTAFSEKFLLSEA